MLKMRKGVETISFPPSDLDRRLYAFAVKKLGCDTPKN
jgi:hypothetical protein